MVRKSNTNDQVVELSAAELAAVLSVPGIGRETVRQILVYLNKYEISFGEFWRKLPASAVELLLSKKQLDSLKNFKKEHTISSYHYYLAEQGIKLISYKDITYPPLLLTTTDLPLLLFAKGNTKILSDQRMIAVVGTRKVTTYGQLATRKLVTELCLEEAIIVSGFMYGIDAEAHQATVTAGGQTVGVLGYGYHHLYPKWQRPLFDSILDQGGVFITEFPPHAAPNAGQFPLRNRIIAGMSQAVVVIEAAAKSGTSITAGLALEEGRLVCAVPGPITSPFSEGTKNLFKQGALMVGSGREVINELELSYPECWLGSYLGQSSSKQSGHHDAPKKYAPEKTICDMLIAQPLSTEKLSQQTQIPVVELNTLLTQLELKGRIVRNGLNWTVVINQ